AVAIKSINVQGTDVHVRIHGYPGHSYQLQACSNPTAGGWANVGSAVSGTDMDIDFAQPGDAGNRSRFYRVTVGP
ncbi:MAG TPA: hypothetical protein VIM48_07785, partial [Chthoniobacterales bacterium]